MTRLGHDDFFRSFASRFLKSASTGVDGLDVKERLVMGVSDEGHLREITEYVPEAKHRSSSLPLTEESDGTLRLLELTQIFFALEHTLNIVYFLDEIERSLHPMLVRKMLDDFLSASHPGQLIVTTHDSNLLDLELLRRDEIWFVEKDALGETHLYSLSDFPVRNDQIKKHYGQGRFGAVPFLEGMNLVAVKESGVK